MTMAAKLRQDLKTGPMIVAPGAYDCITAEGISDADTRRGRGAAQPGYGDRRAHRRAQRCRLR